MNERHHCRFYSLLPLPAPMAGAISALSKSISGLGSERVCVEVHDTACSVGHA